jgi:hypothetical protein
LKILYIPAENFKVKVSRSFFIGKEFSKKNEVYNVFWYDNRNRFWEGKNPSALYTLICFIRSYFSTIRIEKANDFTYNVHASVFINAFIGKLIGSYTAIKWMRRHNRKTLKELVKIIKPDIIYHADGFYFFPALNASIPEFADLQDDINWKNIPDKFIRAEQQYYTEQFNLTKRNFIVSESAAKSFNTYVSCQFYPFSNGADFNTLRNIKKSEIDLIISKFKIPGNKKYVTYIGGAHKFDALFAEKLFKTCLGTLPDIHFILIGNLPKVNLPNVSNIGLIAPEKANIIYALSDIGITLKNTNNDNFLYNSVPLKFIQYAAAKKPIITFPIKWSQENQFKNIFHVPSEDVSEWIKTIENIIADFEWNNEIENQWINFDWKNISDKVLDQIQLLINNPSDK